MVPSTFGLLKQLLSNTCNEDDQIKQTEGLLQPLSETLITQT